MSHPNCTETKSAENPFEGLKINDNQILNGLDKRYPCERCHKSRKYFCYTCYTPHPDLKEIIPKVKLPIKIDIIKHKREIDGKSTAAHAALLAPDDVKVYTYPDIPSYEDERVVLIYPSHTALEIPQLFQNPGDLRDVKSEFDIEGPKGFHRGTLLKNLPTNNVIKEIKGGFEKVPIARAVFIDSTWSQSRGIYKDERICKLPCVVLQNRISQFWRHQKGSPRWYLATVEAIHQFVLEIHLNAWGFQNEYSGLSNCFSEKGMELYSTFGNDTNKAYHGQYDNLLYFFEHMYKLIHRYYDHDNLHAYKRRML